jgi:hypothetical protein
MLTSKVNRMLNPRIKIFRSCEAFRDFNVILLFTQNLVQFLETELLCMKSVACLCTHCHQLRNFCHNQIVVNITIWCPQRSDIRYSWMKSPAYRNMVYLILSLCIWICWSKFTNVIMWGHCAYDSDISESGKAYYSSSIIITNFV